MPVSDWAVSGEIKGTETFAGGIDGAAVISKGVGSGTSDIRGTSAISAVCCDKDAVMEAQISLPQDSLIPCKPDDW